MLVKAQGVSVVHMEGTPFETRALDRVELVIEAGELLGLIGMTGSGKSTMLQALAGLLEIQEGRFVFPDSFPAGRLWQKVGLLFQMPEDQLFEATVFDDISFGLRRMGWTPEAIDAAVTEAMARVGLAPSYRPRSPLELSGGEKRRVAVAGVIAMRPALLLLDEPTAGLDASGRKLFAGLFAELKAAGVTIVLVTHDLDFLAEIADRVAVFHGGKLVGVGPAASILGGVELLREAGLKAPFPVQVLQSLKERGYAVDLTAVTPAAACAEIARVLKPGR